MSTGASSIFLRSNLEEPYEGPIAGGVVVARLCDEVGMFVDLKGKQTILFPTTDELALLGTDMMSSEISLRYTGFKDENQLIEIACTFNPESWEETPIIEPNPGAIGCVIAFSDTSTGGVHLSATPTTGTFKIESCTMTEVMSEQMGTLVGTANLMISFSGDAPYSECNTDYPPSCQVDTAKFIGGGNTSAYIQVLNDPIAVATLREICQ
ncbi:hypothetical protein KKF84_08935 [Myxococcota bacterium]|nr:hypothetical protein [Myxococcota bacterium]MBU1535434.1 hypothetical protein [Myxococcota bacterium]